MAADETVVGGASERPRRPRRVGRFALVGGLALVFAAASLGAAGCSDDDTKYVGAASVTSNVPAALQNVNLIEFHATYTDQQNEFCVTCHGTMLDRVSLDPAKPEFHRYKLDSSTGALPGWVCTDCHKKVDLASGSGGSLRKQVDVDAICYPCHLANGVGTKLYVN